MQLLNVGKECVGEVKRQMNRKKLVIGEVVLLILLAIALAVVIKTRTEKKEIKENEANYVEYERVEAPYEHWLAAAVITSISMDYLDFELENIYIASETEMDNYTESKGVYVTFISENTSKCIFSIPISELRSEPGSFDIFADYIGYATYDEIDISKINEQEYHAVEIKETNTLIEQLERVTKYMN